MNAKTICILFFVLLTLSCQKQQSQTQFNFDFEQIDPNTGKPLGLKYWGTNDYTIELDSEIKQNGKYALSIMSDSKVEPGSFATCVFKIPSKYKGSSIELIGYIKTEKITDGYAGLIMQSEGEDCSVKYFENMQKKGIKGTTDWQLYSINLPLSEEVRTIYAGIIFNGKGKVWADNFHILVDGQDLTEALTKSYESYTAEEDSDFDNGSNIVINNLNNQKIENLSILCKVWGFLKYHHPEIAKGNYNWDYELFRIIPKIINCTNNDERSEILYNWTDKLGKIDRCNTCSDTNLKNAKMLPDFDWIENKGCMSEKLTNQLRYIKDNRNQSKHYYFDLNHAGNPKFKNEDAYRDMLYPDDGFRVLALFRYWNIIQYFFPYRYAIGENWNDVLNEFISKFIDSKDALQYRLTLLEFIARIHDSHANIWGKDIFLEKFKGIFHPNIKVQFIEGTLVFIGYLNQNLNNNYPLKIGDIISKIEGINVEEIVKKDQQSPQSSNEASTLRDIAPSLLFGHNNKVNINYIRNGEEFNVELERYAEDKLAFSPSYYSNFFKRDTCYKFITKNIGYIYPGTIKNDYLPKIFEAFKSTKGIIIDLRCYPSDFIVFSLSNYIMQKPKEFVKFSKLNFNYPGLFLWTSPLKVGTAKEDYSKIGMEKKYFYKGKIVILINEITQSNAEYTAMAFRTAPNAIVIGSTTAGADGNISIFDLPGGIKTEISGIGVYYPDGKETQRIGIIPDIEVKPTIKGIKEGRDEVLEKAIEIIKE